MTLLLENNHTVIGRRPTYESIRVLLADGEKTTVHVARYRRTDFKPRLVLFEKETYLTKWCAENAITEAIGGCFFLRDIRRPLGDLWIDGEKQQSVAFTSPWNLNRGSIYVNPDGKLQIAPRYLFPQRPQTDLLQAGPLLVQAGCSVVIDGGDPEGFSSANHQFDDDLTVGRFPRLAIGTDEDFIFSIACDGRSPGEAGLTLSEMAAILVKLGATDALNLDGGSSTTLIQNGKLRNSPRGGADHNFVLFKKGRPIYSAICFVPTV